VAWPFILLSAKAFGFIQTPLLGGVSHISLKIVKDSEETLNIYV
jgi:hypothetical protein